MNIKRPFRPNQALRVNSLEPVQSLDGKLKLQPQQVITAFALRFWKKANAWVVCLRDGVEFYASIFIETVTKRRRPKRRERLVLRPSYSFR
jgi:hypothetical protein